MRTIYYRQAMISSCQNKIKSNRFREISQVLNPTLNQRQTNKKCHTYSHMNQYIPLTAINNTYVCNTIRSTAQCAPKIAGPINSYNSLSNRRLIQMLFSKGYNQKASLNIYKDGCNINRIAGHQSKGKESEVMIHLGPLGGADDHFHSRQPDTTN